MLNILETIILQARMDRNGNIELPKWIKKIRNKKITPSPPGGPPSRKSDDQFIWYFQTGFKIWLSFFGAEWSHKIAPTLQRF